MMFLTQIYQALLEAWHAWVYFRRPRRYVAILGSARFSKSHPAFEKAYQLSCQLAQHGYVILTGGGQGIMEAASCGAQAAGGKAVGCYVKPIESINRYLSRALAFHSLASRQYALIRYSNALIVFPGGLGTLSELLAALVCIQNKQKTMRLFLIGVSFWSPFIQYVKETLLETYQTIDIEDLEAIVVTDAIEEVMTRF